MAGDVVDRILRPLRQRRVTSRYPEVRPDIAPAARGLPELDPSRCDGSAACVPACPTGAIAVSADTWALDAGACIFCDACARACPRGAITPGHQVELAVLDRRELLVRRDIEVRREIGRPT